MIYVDTSVVVSLLVPDANSDVATDLVQSIHEPLHITTLGHLEIINALNLRVFRKEIDSTQVVDALSTMQDLLFNRAFYLHKITEPTLFRAEQLSRQLTPRIGIRSADILHVAAALELNARSFFSFDRTQRKAAEASGLKINPFPEK